MLSRLFPSASRGRPAMLARARATAMAAASPFSSAAAAAHLNALKGIVGRGAKLAYLRAHSAEHLHREVLGVPDAHKVDGRCWSYLSMVAHTRSTVLEDDELLQKLDGLGRAPIDDEAVARALKADPCAPYLPGLPAFPSAPALGAHLKRAAARFLGPGGPGQQVGAKAGMHHIAPLPDRAARDGTMRGQRFYVAFSPTSEKSPSPERGEIKTAIGLLEDRRSTSARGVRLTHRLRVRLQDVSPCGLSALILCVHLPAPRAGQSPRTLVFAATGVPTLGSAQGANGDDAGLGQSLDLWRVPGFSPNTDAARFTYVLTGPTGTERSSAALLEKGIPAMLEKMLASAKGRRAALADARRSVPAASSQTQ